MLLHASCVAIDGKGVLIGGPPGAGKSDLALRLIDQGAALVADDQTRLRVEGHDVIAAAPASIAGLFEIRHIGLVQMAYKSEAVVSLYIDCAPLAEKLERMPEEKQIVLLDRPLRHLVLPAFAASTPAKIRAALRYPLISERA